MVAKVEEAKPKVRRLTLARIIKDFIRRRMPEACGCYELEKRNGKMEVKVTVKDSIDLPPCRAP